MSKKILKIGVLSMCILCFWCGVSLAQDGVDWEKEIIVASGVGAPSSKAENASQAKAMAYRAAKADAYRNLAEIVNGVQVDSETTVNNLVLQNDTIKIKVNSFIQGARVISEKMDKDGTWHVVMSLNLYGGTNSLAKTIYDNSKIDKKPLPVGVLDNNEPSRNKVTSSSLVEPNKIAVQYTGLVVDATSLKLERCMSPKIIDETGREIYGTMYVDDEYLSQYGILSYVHTPEMMSKVDNGTSRAGNKPLVVKALKTENHGYNMIVSKADGDLILAANQNVGFLQKCAVVAKK